MSAEPSNELIGRVLAGKLRLDALLGAGAAGAVYRAHHLALDRPVAIKVLHQTHTTDEHLVRRFRAEARAASRLDHPNSVRILDFGEDGPDHLLYIAMEFLDGESLQELLAREPQLASWRIASIMAQVSAALAVAHDQGIVHRDIKPGNVMLLRQLGEEGVEQEVVKVCDFGLAKVLDVNPDEMTGGPLTKQGTIFGTPTYMSPEQANGHAVDGRTDQYACAVMMYRMAAGAPPFTADTATGVLMKHILDAPRPVLEVAPHLDPRLAELVDRGLAKEPDDRFASLRDMVPVLREVAAGAPHGAVPQVRLPSTVAPRAATPSVPPAPADVVVSDTFQRPPEPTAPSPMPPPSVETSVAPPSQRAPVLAAVMGSVALLAVGGLGAYVLLGQGGPGSAPAQVAQTTPPPKLQAPKVQAPAPEPEPPKVDVPTPEAPPVTPEPAPKVAPAPKPAKKRAPRPSKPAVKAPEASSKPAPAPAKPEPEPKREPAKPKPEPESAKPEPAKPEVKLAKPEVKLAKPEVVPRPASPPPARPAPLPADFGLSVKVVKLEVGGGLSTRRTSKEVQRALSEAQDCLRTAVTKGGVVVSGKVKVTGTIIVRGRLRSVEADGGTVLVRKCLVEGLSGARMPRPDTGEAGVQMVIAYVAK